MFTHKKISVREQHISTKRSPWIARASISFKNIVTLAQFHTLPVTIEDTENSSHPHSKLIRFNADSFRKFPFPEIKIPGKMFGKCKKSLGKLKSPQNKKISKIRILRPSFYDLSRDKIANSIFITRSSRDFGGKSRE